MSLREGMVNPPLAVAICMSGMEICDLFCAAMQGVLVVRS